MAVSTMDPGFRASWRRAALVSLAVVVLAGVVVALVGGGRSDGDDAASSDDLATGTVAGDGEEGGQVAGPATTVAPTMERAYDGDGSGGGSVAGASLAAGGPTIVVSGTLELRVKGDVARAVERAGGIAAAAGGFVASSSTSTFRAGEGSGAITLRVPADRFDEVRRRVEALGTVRSSERSGQDVGGQLVDLAARLRTLRAEEAALGTILGGATDIGQILQVRDRLTGVRTQIEQLAGQQAGLEDQVAYATFQVSLREAGAPAPRTEPDDDGLAASFRTAVDAAEAVVGGMVVVLGAVAPFAVLAALAGAVLRLGRRRAAVS